MRQLVILISAILSAPIIWTWNGLKWLLAPAPVAPGGSAVEAAASELASVGVETAMRDAPCDLPSAGTVAYRTAIADRSGCLMPSASHLPYYVQAWLNSLSAADMCAILSSRPKDLDVHIAGTGHVSGLSQVLSMAEYLARQQERQNFLDWHAAAVDEACGELLAECDAKGWSQTG